MDDHYDWKDHIPRLADVASLILIYAILLTFLVLLDPSPRHDRDLPHGNVLVNDMGGGMRRPSLGSAETIPDHPRMGGLEDDDRDDFSSDTRAARHCNRKPVPAMNARFCAGGR